MPRAEINALLKFLNVSPDKWNLLLMGDGSGSMASNPGGWACFAVEQGEYQQELTYHRPVYGAVSAGPINWLETLPYWHFLRHHYYYLGGKSLCAKNRVTTHIVTDSQWAAQTMSGRSKAKYHKDMQMMFAMYSEWGYNLVWHHVSRETVMLQSLADRLSAQAREYMQAVELPPEFEERYPLNSTS